MSATCHTITAATSIGLPLASFTFSVSLSKFCTLTLMARRLVNGQVHHTRSG